MSNFVLNKVICIPYNIFNKNQHPKALPMQFPIIELDSYTYTHAFTMS